MLPVSLKHTPLVSTALRWLYVDFNSYFASVEQQLEPHLRGKPVAVVPVMTDSTCAIAASYEAKAFGVKTGTPIWEAKKLCPGILCVPARHEHYVEFHHRILKEIDNHIPVEAVCSIDEVACRLMNNESPEDKAVAIAQSIKRGLAKNVGEYVRCSIGIAPNRYLAKVATDLQKPDGLTVVNAADLPGPLFRLALRDLPGIGRNIERRLHVAGIGSMEQLWALDRLRMRTIWGNSWGEKMWYLLRGADLPDEPTERRTVGHSHVMAPALRPPDQAIHVARRLTLKAASRLRRMGYYASAFSLSMRLEGGPRLQEFEACRLSQDSPTFLGLLYTAWNRALIGGTRNIRIKKVSVTLLGLVPASDMHADLFDDTSSAERLRRLKAERMSAALDKINHRFGRDTVLIGMLPSQGRSFSGTKIAFTRIPDLEEFFE